MYRNTVENRPINTSVYVRISEDLYLFGAYVLQKIVASGDLKLTVDNLQLSGGANFRPDEKRQKILNSMAISEVGLETDANGETVTRQVFGKKTKQKKTLKQTKKKWTWMPNISVIIWLALPWW